VIATAAIVGKLELVCMILLIPHAIDFTFKLISRRPFSQRYIYGDTRARKDGVLIPPPYQSLPHLFMLVEPLTEERLVKVFLLLEAMFALVAVAFFIFI
jgi:UDP-N-acetylmuramyl pentapeptide phosphotransferase/UDP-N-acetylglucosamine-1-phosphate transferase